MLYLGALGDLHLDERSPRYNHVIEVAKWAITDFCQGIPDKTESCLIFLGDIFDSEDDPTSQEYFDFLSLVNLARTRGIDKICIVLGNHEHYNALSFFELIDPRIVVADRETVAVRFASAEVLLVPYPRRGRPPFDSIPTEGTIQESLQAAVGIIRDRVQQAVQISEEYRPLIVAGHFTLEGMTTRDTEFERHHRSEVVVPLEVFQPGVAAVIVGHIHKPQMLTHEWTEQTEIAWTLDPIVAPIFIGAGSLIRNSFSESMDVKSYSVLKCGDVFLEFEPRELPVHGMIEIEVGFENLKQSISSLIAQHSEHLKDLEVKVVVNINDTDLPNYDDSVFDDLKRISPYVLIDRRTESTQRVRAPEIKAADTLTDQFKAYAESVGIILDTEQAERITKKLSLIESAIDE